MDWIVSMDAQVHDCAARRDRDGLLKLAAEYAAHNMTQAATRVTILAVRASEQESK